MASSSSSQSSDAMKHNTANLKPSPSGNPSSKARSGSSDLSDLSTESGGVQRSSSMQSSSSDNRFHVEDPDDIDYDSMESSEDDVPLSTSKRVPSREDRPKFRNLLNTKLEQMFSEKGIPLTPYGRIPWTTLGETLADKGVYITGFPQDLAPRAVNDHLSAGTSPSTWGINRTKPLLELISAGKIRILPRPPGRRVLFELTRPDGSKYDSTIGYSSRWLHTHMSKEFPAVKRSRSDVGNEKSKRSRSQREDSEESSDSDSDDNSHSWGPHRKRSRYSEPKRPMRESRMSSQQTTRSRRLKEKQQKPKSTLHDVKQGEKWKEGGIVKRIGRGWIVVEESTEEDDDEEEEEDDEDETEQTTEVPEKAQTPPTSASPEQGQSKKRQHSESSESSPRPTKRVHQATESKAEMASPSDLSGDQRLKNVMQHLSKLIREAGYVGSKKIPWSTLPEFLCEKQLYITGFPYLCLPTILDDEVKNVSSPPHWKPAQCAAMEGALNRNLVKILPRTNGRRVLFEAIGVDDKTYDTTCGYSSAWIGAHMKDLKSTDNGDSRDPDSPSTPSKADTNRPALKIVIPDNGGRIADTIAHTEKKPASLPASDARKRSQVDKESTPKQPSPFTPIPRAPIPTPVIFLQPPTPPAGQDAPKEREKLEFHDSPMVDSTSKNSETENTPQSTRNLALPPSPTLMDPVHLPSEVFRSSESLDETKPIVPKRANFTFIIPPAKGSGVKRGRGRPRKFPLNKDPSSSSTSKSMSVDRDGSSQSQGYDLSLMFDSPSKENPDGGLPAHLQPRPLSELPSKAPKKLVGWQSNMMTAPRKTWKIGEEVVGVIPFTANGALDNKHSVENQVRPALIKLFDVAGLSSPGAPLPWIMLPKMLCKSRLFISGFPGRCLPRVVRDKVDGNSGPRAWSFATLMEMLNALKAGEVRIKRRPRGRKVLFHILPTDAQRERGEIHGVDSTLGFSQTWLDEYMVDDPSDSLDEEMQFEPTGMDLVTQSPVQTPLQRESVWERFGKIKIEESSSEEGEGRVPDPPWKVALEQFTRPLSSQAMNSPPDYVPKWGPGQELSSSDSSDDGEGEVKPSKLSLSHLLPSFLPHAFQNKGRILLGKDDLFEWVPNNVYATDCPPSRMIWSAKKKKWELLPEIRNMSDQPRPRIEVPNRVSGRVLSEGICEHNATRKVWECSFVGRAVFGDLRWSPDVGAWEWFLQDSDGRRKWVTRDTPDREYQSAHEDF